MRRLLWVFWMMMALLPMAAGAETWSRRIPQALSVDQAAMALRRALNGYERAGLEGLPQGWSPLALTQGRLVELGGDHHLVLQEAKSGSATMLHLYGSTSRAITLAAGATTESEAITLILVESTPGAARVLVRASEVTPAFADVRPAGGSRVKLTAHDGGLLMVESPRGDDLRFAERYLAGWCAGTPDEVSLATAWRAHPPVRNYAAARTVEPAFSYTDPTNVFDGDDSGLADVLVTLTTAEVESSAVSQLNTAIAYRSDGRTGESRVAGRVDGDGGTVSVGGPGDRFSATLRALEAQGRVKGSSEVSVRVPMNDWASFSYQSAGGYAQGSVAARNQGRRIGLDFDLASGGSGSRSSRTSRVTVAPGRTVLVARYQSSRTSSSSSGPPLVGGVPYIGPLLGNSEKRSASYDWVLYATVTQE